MKLTVQRDQFYRYISSQISVVLHVSLVKENSVGSFKDIMLFVMF